MRMSKEIHQNCLPSSPQPFAIKYEALSMRARLQFKPILV